MHEQAAFKSLCNPFRDVLVVRWLRELSPEIGDFFIPFSQLELILLYLFLLQTAEVFFIPLQFCLISFQAACLPPQFLDLFFRLEQVGTEFSFPKRQALLPFYPCFFGLLFPLLFTIPQMLSGGGKESDVPERVSLSSGIRNHLGLQL